MCGFAVVIGREAVRAASGASAVPPWAAAAAPGPVPAGRARAVDVETALARRGPDEIAWSLTREAIVASSRLIHWEEGAATQPFTDDEGGFGVFNGELFNLADLQRDLGRPGSSEVEVLVAGLRTHGHAFFARIDGQFAAVLRTHEEGPYVAVRDRFGIAPLYVAALEGGVGLASNLESLLAITHRPFELSLPGLRGVLTTWAPTGGLTAAAGVHQVAPGELVVAAPDGTWHREDWAAQAFSTFTSGPRPIEASDILDSVDTEGPGGEDLAAELEAALRQSVRDRLRSTTPVSCLVSGGIDSTIIAALAADLGVRRGIGLVLQGDGGEDGVAARQRRVAQAVGLDLLQHTLTPAETVETLEHFVATRRVPLVRLGPVGMAALARRARREGVRAVLSGEGADELFAGYDSYRILAARGGLLGPTADLDWSAFGEPEFDAHRGPRWARGYWRSLVRLAGGAATGRADLLRPVADLLAPGLLEVPVGRVAPREPADTVLPPEQPLLARREEDLRDLLGAYLLTMQGDHAWMEESVELRPPYLAQGVAALALQRSPADFIDASAGKQPVRQVLARLARHRPALAELGYAKAAFRVDVRFVLADPDAFERLTALIGRAPHDLVHVEATLDRAAACAAAGTCSEAESMLFTFAASLGVLGSLAPAVGEPSGDVPRAGPSEPLAAPRPQAASR